LAIKFDKEIKNDKIKSEDENKKSLHERLLDLSRG